MFHLVCFVYFFTGFNSTLVQLKGNNALLYDEAGHRFNSTLVQLKVEGATPYFGVGDSFNSTLVQLKGVMVGYLERK